MAVSCARILLQGSRLCYLSAALISTSINFAWPAVAGESIVVPINQSTIINLPGDLPGESCGTKTIVIRNPHVADIALLSKTSGKLFIAIIGRGYGSTSVVAYDCKGAELLNKIVEVTGPPI